MTKSRLLRLVKIVAINLFILALLFEIGSLGLYFHHTGRFFYARGPGGASTIPATALLDEGGRGNLNRRLHPYLGFVYDEQDKNHLPFSDVQYSANNFGIFSPYNYPFKKSSDDQFIIGIFGGSVAMYYGFYELETHTLANTLKQLPYFKDRQIVVLPFASGSYKQPQQLIELSYFAALGQDFDLIINLDGFNETALAYQNIKSRLDPSMPSVEMFGPLVQLANQGFSAQQIDLTLEILKLKKDLKETQLNLDRCRFATCYGFRWLQWRYFWRRYQKSSQQFNSLAHAANENESLVHLDMNSQSPGDAEVFPALAALWARSEISMSQLLAAKRIPYFCVVQPNQYNSTERKFGEAEQRTALNSSSAYAEGVVKGYPQLIVKIDDLKSSGVKVINATNVFDNVAEPVYIDSCCHYNQTGNRIFATFVADAVMNSLATDQVRR